MTELQLGNKVSAAASPDEAIIDRVPNPQQYSETFPWPWVARFTCPEFTSLCPVTGQPDFALLVIDYVPDKWLLESKSLKLFLTSFRNHGAFHEDCTIAIGKRIVDTIEPDWLRIAGYWNARGGIPIDVFWQTSNPPDGIWMPPHDVPLYRSRG